MPEVDTGRADTNLVAVEAIFGLARMAMICSSLCRVPFMAVLLSWVWENSHSRRSSFRELRQLLELAHDEQGTCGPQQVVAGLRKKVPLSESLMDTVHARWELWPV